MTLNQLHQALGILLKTRRGLARCPVSIDKPSFRDNRESDGCVILPLCKVDMVWVPEADGDGGVRTNKDGSERGKLHIVLGGSAYQSVQSERG